MLLSFSLSKYRKFQVSLNFEMTTAFAFLSFQGSTLCELKIVSVRGNYRTPQRERRIPLDPPKIYEKPKGGKFAKHQCKICYKKYTSPAGHSHHMKTVHFKKCLKKPKAQKSKVSNVPFEKHQCHICDKVYSGSAGLYFHIATHTKQYRYRCYICDKGFMKRGDLFGSHLNFHRKALGELKAGQSPKGNRWLTH